MAELILCASVRGMACGRAHTLCKCQRYGLWQSSYSVQVSEYRSQALNVALKCLLVFYLKPYLTIY